MSDATNKRASQPPQPGLEHAVFQNDVGTWDATIEIRLAPGAPPQLSKGVSINSIACGGRWLIVEFKNETTGFQGHGIYGWDSSKGSYRGVWVDNMRTFIAVSEGTWDEAAKTMTMWTEAPGPGGRPIRWRDVTQTVDADTQVFRSFFPGPGGAEFEMMTVTYKRRRP